MDNLSLYDLLVGCFALRGDDPGDVDDAYFDHIMEDEKLRQSIVENLTLVLQTRQGSVQHLSDFGIPDIRQVYFDEGTIESVPERIRETILKYEPRLGEVRVKKKEFDERNMRMTLEISAQIKQTPGKEVLFTEFSTTGWTKVYFERDKE
ncbi:MAG: type VI secretion system baseplate subunit TssE [Calditrichia bacterium]|nr:type VI secretion system baseplate subunit TssE [Calditrichia bacterium]